MFEVAGLTCEVPGLNLEVPGLRPGGTQLNLTPECNAYYNHSLRAPVGRTFQHSVLTSENAEMYVRPAHFSNESLFINATTRQQISIILYSTGRYSTSVW